ncbi:MAG: transcriptional regulator [archaeon]|nr:transcriptional regulator [archaeon]
MSLTEISDSVLQTQNSSWDYVLDESGSLEDISLEKVSESIARINARGHKIPTDPMDFLRKNRLMRDGKLTFAAQMLFAKDWHVNTAVQMGRFIDPIHIKDRDEAHGDLVTQVDQLFGFVKKHINCAVVISGKPENDLVWDYPLEAIREIILNMVVHRDYRAASESCIKIFDDRIEFFNPGSLLDDMTVEDLLNNSYLSTLRNKAIANHFHELGEIEKYGSGVTRVLQMFREAGNPELKIEATGTGVKVTAFALGVKVADKADKIADKIADKTALTTSEKKVLAVVNEVNGCGISLIMEKTGFSNSYIRKNLALLVEKKLVERRGSKKTGGYFVV